MKLFNRNENKKKKKKRKKGKKKKEKKKEKEKKKKKLRKKFKLKTSKRETCVFSPLVRWHDTLHKGLFILHGRYTQHDKRSVTFLNHQIW